MEPEEYADLLQKFRDLCEQIVPRHGGEIVRVDGDGVLCIFGYPVAYEDAGRRATEAALDLHDAASALDQSFASTDLQIRLHTGIHSGTVLVRAGDVVRGRFEILGDATNVAARLCDHAAADQIIVSEATLGADRPFFGTGPLQQVHVSGRQQSLPVYTVSGREPMANRFAARVRRGVAPFAGRLVEFARLVEAARKCRDGHSRVIIIAGPAGIGKTRLASEFLDHSASEGAVVHRGYCEAYLGARPFQPFIQIITSLLDGRPDSSGAAAQPIKTQSPGQIDILRRLLSLPTVDADFPSPTDVAVALVDFLECDDAAAAETILWIDDWQWVDDASRQVFDAVAANAKIRILLVLCSRQSDPMLSDGDRTDIIQVPPLDSNDAEAAIEGLLATPQAFLVERIKDHAGGSPLFIEELCHAMLDGQDALVRNDRSAWLDIMIQTRFARLATTQGELVKIASVIGHMIPQWLFETITGEKADAPAMRQLMDEDFIYRGETIGTLRFKHGITRDAIYRTVALKERQTLHRRVADVLREKSAAGGEAEYYEALAYHYGAAGEARDALHYAVAAGDRAMAASALDRAQAQYRVALETIDRLRPSAELSIQANQVLRKFGLACVVDPSRDQLPVFRREIERARASGNAGAIAWSEYWHGFVLYGLGESRQATLHLERAAEAARMLDDNKLTVMINATLGQAFATGCDYAAALPLLDEAIAIKQRHRKPSRPSIVLSYTLACRALVYADQGHFDQAHAEFDEAVSALAGVEHEMTASVLTLRCAACLWQGRYQEALDLALYSRAIAERAKARYIYVNCGSLSGYAEWCISRNPAILNQIVKATGWLETSASQQFSSLNFGWLAEMMASIGRFTAARHYAARAFNRARSGDQLGEAMAARAMVSVAAAGKSAQTPEHYLQRASQSADKRGAAHEMAQNWLCEAELSLSRGQHARSSMLISQAIESFARMEMEPQLSKARALASNIR
jgi:class 3 adenylate cyclase/tetratricopeptide (TPR) repeat protein